MRRISESQITIHFNFSLFWSVITGDHKFLVETKSCIFYAKAQVFDLLCV